MGTAQSSAKAGLAFQARGASGEGHFGAKEKNNV